MHSEFDNKAALRLTVMNLLCVYVSALHLVILGLILALVDF